MTEPTSLVERVTDADIVAWTTVAEVMRDRPDAFSAYSAAGCARQFLAIVQHLQAAHPPVAAPGVDLEAIAARCEAARQMVGDLCRGYRSWTMRVPAQPDDPDLTIAGALADIPDLLAYIAALRDEIESLQVTVVGLREQAALRATPSSSWMPISTARKDGKKIDLGQLHGNGKFTRAPDCYWHKKARQWMCKHYSRDGYSLIRLPPAPSAATITEAPDKGEKG